MSKAHHHHSSLSNLKLAFFLNLGFTIFEIIGGIYTNSIAIISDAVHDLGDSLSLGTAWFLQKKSNQKSDKNFSYGYARFSLLGALLNSLVLIIGSIFVINEAVKRLINPEPTDAAGMIVFAIVGVAVNGYAAWKLSSGVSMNEKVVSWHLLEDVLGWAAVLVAAIVLLFWDIPFLDPALSLTVCAFILWNVIKRFKETIYIFLQGVPKQIELPTLINEITKLEHVDSLHHTHVWSLDGEESVFTTHLKLRESVNENQLISLRAEMKKVLMDHHIAHSAVEIEHHNEECILMQETETECDH